MSGRASSVARLVLLAAALPPLSLSLAGTAAADDYDNALRCVAYVEMAKENYTGANVDALREAGNKMVEWVDSSRPKDLTDQQKIDRWTTAIEKVQKAGGVTTPEGRQAAIDCAGYFGVELVIPE